MNNSKAGLLLLELTISILFFTLSCVVILSLFVLAHNTTKDATGISESSVIAGNIAEQYRSGEVDFDSLKNLSDEKYDIVLEENKSNGINTLNIHIFDKYNYKEYCNLEVKRYSPMEVVR